MKKDDIILVYYIDVRNMSMQNIQEVLFQAKEKLAVNNPEIVQIFVPSDVMRIECINPVLLDEEHYEKVKWVTEEYEKVLVKFLDPLPIPEDIYIPVSEEMENDPNRIVVSIEEESWLTRLIQKFANVFSPDPIKPVEDDKYTCSRCKDKEDCELAFDEYNTNGDCLAIK